MNISYNWLKRYIATDLPAEKIAEILTDIGLEVEGFEKIETVKGGYWIVSCVAVWFVLIVVCL